MAGLENMTRHSISMFDTKYLDWMPCWILFSTHFKQFDFYYVKEAFNCQQATLCSLKQGVCMKRFSSPAVCIYIPVAMVGKDWQLWCRRTEYKKDRRFADKWDGTHAPWPDFTKWEAENSRMGCRAARWLVSTPQGSDGRQAVSDTF